jgi:RNA polymerase sigma factor (TIGR02999 family)
MGVPGDDVDDATRQQVSELLAAWTNGDPAARDQLLPVVYAELRRLAHHFMAGEQRGHTLQTTALVHEAYLRLVDLNRMRWHDRGHFFAMAATLMRRILVDSARQRERDKRGGGITITSIDDHDVAVSPTIDVVALDDALNQLAAMDPQQSRIVELRFFGGLTIAETADALDISPTTVKREWTSAKAWLHAEISGRGPDA